jgi:PAS domain S-box-containing protein
MMTLGADSIKRFPWPRLPFGIGARLTLILCAVVVLASAAVGWTIYWQFYQALAKLELNELSKSAEISSVRFTSDMRDLRTDTLFVSGTPVIQDLVRSLDTKDFARDSREMTVMHERTARLFHRLLRSKPTYCQARLIGIADGGREIVRVNYNPQLRTAVTVPPDELQQTGKEPYFVAALRLSDDEVFLSDVTLNREHGRIASPPTPVVRAAAPVFGADGSLKAIVVINRYFQPLVEEWRRTLNENQTLYVTNGGGDYLVHPDAEKTFGFEHGRRARIQDDYSELAAAFNLERPSSDASVVMAPSGQRKAIGVQRAPLDPNRSDRFVVIAVESPYRDAMAQAIDSRNHSILAAMSVLCVALAVGLVISRSMTRPLREIAAAAQCFGSGKLDVALPTQRKDEVGVVARTLDEMMHEVQSTHADLEQRASQLADSRQAALNVLQDVESSRQRIMAAERSSREQGARTQAILDCATDAIITISAGGVVESYNRAAEQMFGYSPDQVIGENVTLLMPSPYREEHDQYLRNYLATGVARIIGIGREVVGRRADGSTFPMHLAVSEVKLGRRRLFTGIVRDITDIKQAMDQICSANNELARRSRQIERFNLDLKRSNDELRQFAYVASHDLQEPLRKVAAFCQMLDDEYADRLDEEGQRYIRYAVDGSIRMKALIQDLLTYSRVETQGKPLEPTEAAGACAEAVENLSLTIQEAGAQVACDPLPTIVADRAQLVRLFQNLIGNAIKYRGPDPPQVHVSASERDGSWEFRIRDNGLGIDPQYHERIFVIFQRLHAREEYSGTGIGLAVCKRIVERAGGTIWVESAVGAGSTFCFTFMSPQSSSPHGEANHDRLAAECLTATD